MNTHKWEVIHSVLVWIRDISLVNKQFLTYNFYMQKVDLRTSLIRLYQTEICVYYIEVILFLTVGRHVEFN